jgi:hypothetical protein
VAEAGPVKRAWLAWRRWRRTRPFWGGLLIILGGTEILLSEQAPLPVIIHIGLQGLAGYLIPVVLILCGLLLLFHPVQQAFYSILAVVLSLGSWITSNLGGFFVGMLLGLVGGSLAFAWGRTGQPEPPQPAPRARPTKPPSEGLGLILRDPEHTARAGGPESDGRMPPADAADGPRRGAGHRQGGKLLTVSAIPAVFVMLIAIPGHLPPPRGSWQAAATASELGPSSPKPTPSLTATPTASLTQSSPSPTTTVTTPTATPTPTTTTPIPTPTGTVSPGPTPSPTASSHRSRRHHLRARPPALTVSAVASTIAAGSLAFTEVSFDGVASVPTAHGTVSMLVFSMTSMTFSGPATLTVRRYRHSLVTTGSSFGFTGHVLLYTTKLSGDLNGVKVTFTPKNPPLGLHRNLVFTNVVVTRPYAISDSLQANGLTLVGI